jgi:hypothetical protein
VLFDADSELEEVQLALFQLRTRLDELERKNRYLREQLATFKVPTYKTREGR